MAWSIHFVIMLHALGFDLSGGVLLSDLEKVLFTFVARYNSTFSIIHCDIY